MVRYDQLSIEDGEILVKTSRTIVTEFLKNRTKVALDKKFESNFSFNSGIFVTLCNPLGLQSVTKIPELKEKLDSNFLSNATFILFFRNSVTMVLEVLTRTCPSSIES